MENWISVNNANAVNDKVSIFTTTIVHMLNKWLPKRVLYAFNPLVNRG